MTVKDLCSFLETLPNNMEVEWRDMGGASGPMPGDIDIDSFRVREGHLEVDTPYWSDYDERLVMDW